MPAGTRDPTHLLADALLFTHHDVILGASPANPHPSHGLPPTQVTYNELSYNGLCIDSGDFVPERSAAYIEQL